MNNCYILSWLVSVFCSIVRDSYLEELPELLIGSTSIFVKLFLCCVSFNCYTYLLCWIMQAKKIFPTGFSAIIRYLNPLLFILFSWVKYVFSFSNYFQKWCSIWFIYASRFFFRSSAMLCFYFYVLISGGNPPPKKLKPSSSTAWWDSQDYTSL